jgi:hypothetical protein
MTDAVSVGARFAVLLRQRLAERARAAPVTPTGERSVSGPNPASPGAVTALAAAAGAPRRQLRRALVEELLVDHFGSALLNAPKFQQVVERTLAAIEDEPRIAALMEKSIDGLSGRAD